MKIATIALCLAAAVAAIPFQQQQPRYRLIRDVSEILATPEREYLPPSGDDVVKQSIYLPPVEPLEEEQAGAEEVEVEAAPIAVAKDSSADIGEENTAGEIEVVEAATEAVPETAVLGENGYEYRVVRKLRMRRRRDVSHLNLGYLPPLPSTRISSHYLPPQLDVPQPETPQLKISNEYLPPMSKDLVRESPTIEAVETEAPETEAPITTTEAAITTTTETAAPEETAVLANDGYHYRKPDVQPDLGFSPLVEVAEPQPAPEAPVPQEPEVVQDEVKVQSASAEAEPQPTVEQELAPELVQTNAVEPERAYLPPLEPGVVEAEGPGEESAALLDDGYHYRVVKHVKLF